MRSHISRCVDVLCKRTFDIITAFFVLGMMSPLLCYVAWRIKREDVGPIYYRGVRIGRDGKAFAIYKFRTMVVDADVKGPSSTADDDPRLTHIGAWLRKYKIDELPQLFNVLRGDMSIVGPRPQVPWAVAAYRGEEKDILLVRPGITDPASVRFHNEGEILKGSKDADKTYMEKIHPEKMRLAIAYVHERTFFRDMKIIFDTVRTLYDTRSHV